MLRSHSTVVEIDAVSSPKDVKASLLTSLLNTHYKRNTDAKDAVQVASLQWQPLGRGVMSNVQLLNVCYDDDPGHPHHDIPKQFLAKFRKEEIPLEELFPVEGQFYQLSSYFPSDFPFQLVNAIATGPNWLLMEYIPPTENILIMDVHEGCPADRFDGILIRLARMHAACWVSNTTTSAAAEPSEESIFSLPLLLKAHASKLSSTPGAGHTLPPTMRQEQFEPGWPAVRKRLAPYFNSKEGSEDLKQLDNIVSWTAQSSRIEDIAHSVADRKYTLVHGDFHIGNMLLQKAPEEGNGKTEQQLTIPWLVDWSMAGIGNPCVDLAFFLAVGADAIPTYELSISSSVRNESLTNATTTERVGLILEQYYQALTTLRKHVQDDSEEASNSKSKTPQSPLLPWDTFLTMYSECILNQFIILVCYDSLCRSMADASPTSQVYHDHFDRVNTRCARMLLTEFGMRRLRCK